MGEQHDITRLLQEWNDGDQDTLDRLFTLVYEELHLMAHNRLIYERHGHTLSTTDLVNEAYLKLVDQTRTDWKNRAHFMAIASQAMRRILVTYARNHYAQKRGGKKKPISLDETRIGMNTQAADLLDLDNALDRLSSYDERLPKVVECRFFGGLTEKETAQVLDISVRTVNRDWVKARAWLYKELYSDTT